MLHRQLFNICRYLQNWRLRVHNFLTSSCHILASSTIFDNFLEKAARSCTTSLNLSRSFSYLIDSHRLSEVIWGCIGFFMWLIYKNHATLLPNHPFSARALGMSRAFTLSSYWFVLMLTFCLFNFVFVIRHFFGMLTIDLFWNISQMILIFFFADICFFSGNGRPEDSRGNSTR